MRSPSRERRAERSRRDLATTAAGWAPQLRLRRAQRPSALLAGDRGEHRFLVDNADHTAVVDGADGLLAVDDHRHRAAHGRADVEARPVLFACRWIAHDPPKGENMAARN